MLMPLQIESIVRNALLEDLSQGDVTTDAIPSFQELGRTEIRTRQTGTLSGLLAAKMAFQLVDATVQVETHLADGARMASGDLLATVRGPIASLLKAERTALNFLQHLCGVATETRRYVDALQGSLTRITDTRKTTPGLRMLEKQAILDGGASPHRYHLGSCVMLKDNHLEAFGDVAAAIQAVKANLSHTMKVEVEVDHIEMIEPALQAGADIILLDNMSPSQVKAAVTLIGHRAITEASGGISLETLANYAATGVQYISTSKITLGAPALDIGLDFVTSG